MINSKIMSGKNVVSRLNFEQYFANCKSVLVVSDLWSDICGAKNKIKNAFSKETKVTFVKIKASDYAEVTALDNCLQKFKEVQADMIVSSGSDVACNLAKAVKYISTFGVGSFEDFCKLHFDENNVQSVESNQISPVKLLHLSTSSGDHEQILTGRFEIFDKKGNTFYRFNKKSAIIDTVILDEKLLDKMSIVGGVGVELGSLAMALISLANCDEEEKIAARTAISMFGGEKTADICEMYVAQMTAGHSFLGLKNNLLQEVIFGIQMQTRLLFSQVMVLLFKNSFDKLVDKISIEDINLLGDIYQISLQDNVEEWKKQFASLINAKLEKYFEDKDIPSCLNEAGLNSEHIEDIFVELEQQYKDNELLKVLKDLTYAAY